MGARVSGGALSLHTAARPKTLQAPSASVRAAMASRASRRRVAARMAAGAKKKIEQSGASRGRSRTKKKTRHTTLLSLRGGWRASLCQTPATGAVGCHSHH